MLCLLLLLAWSGNMSSAPWPLPQTCTEWPCQHNVRTVSNHGSLVLHAKTFTMLPRGSTEIERYFSVYFAPHQEPIERQQVHGTTVEQLKTLCSLILLCSCTCNQ